MMNKDYSQAKKDIKKIIAFLKAEYRKYLNQLNDIEKGRRNEKEK